LHLQAAEEAELEILTTLMEIEMDLMEDREDLLLLDQELVFMETLE
jgi:hypothetical protein